MDFSSKEVPIVDIVQEETTNSIEQSVHVFRRVFANSVGESYFEK